jgi:hypothetical protein
MTHWYIYVRNEDGTVYYERTCGTLDSAERRVRELKERGKDAWHQTSTYPGAFY